MYSGKPSSIVTAGSKPNVFRVALMSARLSRTSPAHGGPCRTTGFSPLTAFSRSTRSLMLMRVPLPMLNTPETPRAIAALMLACTTSRTFTKSRVCSPSPKMVTGSPRNIWNTKIGMTLPYASKRWLGPYTLK
jgi:hypothetical protein